MAIRFLSASLLASGVTLALFWIMTALIASEAPELSRREFTTIEIVKVRKAQPPIPKVRQVLVRPAPAPAPIVPRLSPSPGPGRFTIPNEINQVDPLARRARPGIGLAQAESDATPLVRIAPRYPDQALARGQEGRVLIEFTIGRSGAVHGAAVIASEPPGVFDKAALEAVRQWRYSPKIENGEPVEQPGQRIVIPFVREARNTST